MNIEGSEVDSTGSPIIKHSITNKNIFSPTAVNELSSAQNTQNSEGMSSQDIKELAVNIMRNISQDDEPNVVAAGLVQPPENITNINDENLSLSEILPIYIALENRKEDFFFSKVEGLFEYVLFLIMIQYTDILGPWIDELGVAATNVEMLGLNNDGVPELELNDYAREEMKNKIKTKMFEIINSDKNKYYNVNAPSSESNDAFVKEEINNCVNEKFVKYFTDKVNISTEDENEILRECLDDMRVIKGGAIPVCNILPNNPNVKPIQIQKLYKELNHDFKGRDKSLEDIDDIRKFYKDYLKSITRGVEGGSIWSLSKSLDSSSDEWSFYTNILEYFIEYCDGLNDLTMIRYRSVTSPSDEKSYLLRDINAPPDSDTYYNKLFNAVQFQYRYQDNGTNDTVLKYIIHNPDGFEPYIIQNAPSLMDPANIHPIPMSKFYPSGDSFQQAQDLNNISNDTLYVKVQEIILLGINQFCSYFGSSINFAAFVNSEEPVTKDNYQTKYDALPVKFIVTNTAGYELNTAEEFGNYYDHMKRLKEGQQDNQEYYYKGVRITTGGYNYDLHVKDTTIINIANLINEEFYKKNPSIKSESSDLKKSWYRLYTFANLIYNGIQVTHHLKEKNKDDVIRMIIICLKSFGDSFQVYYSTMIQQQPQQPQINTYLSSSDKNTGAEKLLYNSPFLLNGCGIVPYQEMRQRFASFFNDDLVTQLEDRGDIGDGNYSNYEFGSMKAILTNIEQKARDYIPSVIMLANNITSLYGKLQQDVKEQVETELKKHSSSNMEVVQGNVPQIDLLEQYRIGNVENGKAKEVNDELQKIYNTLKIFVVTDNQLDSKINEIGQIIEEQNKALIKMVELKREPTTEEYQKIIDKLEKQPPDSTIQEKLKKIVGSNITGAVTFTNKINDFCEKVTGKISSIRKNIKEVIIKNMKNENTRRTSRLNSYGSVMEMIIKKLKTTVENTGTGGGKRTVKHKRIRRKKQTIKKKDYINSHIQTRRIIKKKREHKHTHKNI